MKPSARKSAAALSVAALLHSTVPSRAGFHPLLGTAGILGGLAAGGIALAIAKKRAACRADPACRARMGAAGATQAPLAQPAPTP